MESPRQAEARAGTPSRGKRGTKRGEPAGLVGQGPGDGGRRRRWGQSSGLSPGVGLFPGPEGFVGGLSSGC